VYQYYFQFDLIFLANLSVQLQGVHLKKNLKELGLLPTLKQE